MPEPNRASLSDHDNIYISIPHDEQVPVHTTGNNASFQGVWYYEASTDLPTLGSSSDVP